jgi:hypothetical protein
MKKYSLFFVISMALFSACSKSTTNANIDCSTAKSFTTDVLPVVLSTCSYSSSCHATGSTRGPGALVNYSQVFANRTSIRGSVMNGSMPENSSLTTSELNAIVCWIDSGATEN